MGNTWACNTAGVWTLDLTFAFTRRVGGKDILRDKGQIKWELHIPQAPDYSSLCATRCDDIVPSSGKVILMLLPLAATYSQHL